ncbi:MAG TPA: phenylalanine--tRNA ligase subunit beta [Candidatus Acidoferrum sp.]|nr:phenylalanine--tRNA ligase subunit beta [Candidatus Acidoferrum sp.]
MKISPQWVREFVDLSVDDQRLAEDLTAAGIAVEGISGSGADTVFEMEIGTNRPDAMNHYGIAREAAAIYDLRLKELSAVSSQLSANPSKASVKASDMALKRRSSTGRGGAKKKASAAKAASSAASHGAAGSRALSRQTSGAEALSSSASYGTTRVVPFPITVEEPELCPRFSARVIRGTRIKASPEKIAHRLRLLDQRPISNAVDATNYVLWEMGKPTHVFDMGLLEGGRLIIRRAKDGEKLKTLDGVERTLSSEDLVVADAKKPVGLAGVMGGFDTMITDRTKNILIESAWWDPVTVRKTSRRHGIHTDASHRFERGADFESTVLSCDLVAKLILESGGGELVGGAIDVVSRQMDQAPIVLRLSEVHRILGGNLSAGEIFRILKKLGFGVIPEGQADAKFRVQIPSWRLDVEREIDLLEEIARVHGYDKFENTLPAYSGAVVDLPNAAMDVAFRERALALGYNEAVSLTFISHAAAETFGFLTEASAAIAVDHLSASTARLGAAPFQSASGRVLDAATLPIRNEPGLDAASLASGTGRVLELENPLSEEASVMRTSLAPGMLDMLAWNLNRDAEEVRLFEMGRVYEMRSGERVEPQRACLGATMASVVGSLPAAGRLDISGPLNSPFKPKEGLNGAPLQVEAFRGFKGDVENLLAAFSYRELSFDRKTAGHFHRWRSARALMDGAVVAQFGQIAEEVKAERKLRQDIFLAEFDLDELHARGLRAVRFAALGKYPAVERDFSFVFSDEVEFEAMRRAVMALGIRELREFRPVEIFRGGSIGASKYSILLRAKLQSDEGTLRDEQIAQWAEKMVGALKGIGGVQRA